MFNFGWGELLLIGVIALIAIGPKELPTVLRTIGQALGKVRRMANEFQGQFQDALREADITDLKKQADDLTSSFKDSVADISDFDPMADTQKEMEDSLSLDSPIDTSGESDTVAAIDSVSDEPAELPAPAAETPAIEEPKPTEKPTEKSTEKPAKKAPRKSAAKKSAPKESPKPTGGDA